MTISEFLEREKMGNTSTLGSLSELAKYQSSVKMELERRLHPTGSTVARYANELGKYQASFKPTWLSDFVEKERRMREVFSPPALTKFMEQEKALAKAMNPLKDLLAQDDRLKIALSPLRELVEQSNRFRTALDYANRISEIGSIAAEAQKRMPRLAFQNVGKMFDSFRDVEIGAIDFENYSFVSPSPEENLDETQIIVDESSRIKRIITDVCKDISTLRVIGHHDFEKMVTELMRDRGYEVELTKQTRDGGYDIIALHRMSGMNPLKYLVECKHWNNKVNVSIVRSFTAVFQREDGNRGLIVTSSYFTKDAHEERKKFTPYSLELKDRDDLMDWVRSYGGIYVRS